MSNVFRRFQEKTGLEFWDNAVEIETELTRFLMNEQIIPKRYRYVYTIPILNTVKAMWHHIIDANTIYPVDESSLRHRMDCQQLAINSCENIIQDIQRMIFVLSGIDVDKLDGVGQKLIKESALLRAWRKSSKIQKQK